MSAPRPPQPHARFSARLADLRSASKRRWMVLAGVVLLVAATVWVVGFSPLLSVRSVQVSGTKGELADRVRVQADPVVGRPLVRADAAAVRRRIERIPAVQSVEVSRRLPNTLSVQVRPRVPVVVLQQRGDRRLVDASGRDYAAATGAQARGLPVVRLGEDGVSGKDVAAVARVMAALPAKERDQVKDVRLSRIGHVSFRLGGLKVAWGASAHSGAKAEALSAMRPIATKEGSRTLDVSSPKRPVLG